MTDKKDLTPGKYEGPKDLIVQDAGEFANWLDTGRFNHLWRIANIFSLSGAMVPVHFQNQPEACFVAVQMAFRLGVDPMMFLQKSYNIKGKPGIEATLAIALCNTNGPFTGPIQYKWSGDEGKDNWTCTAYATHKATEEVCEISIDMKMVKDAGWGNNWKTMPRLMFMYRTAMWLIRAYCPEVILGMHSLDELRDAGEVIDVSPIIDHTDAKNASIQERLDSLSEPIAETQETPTGPTSDQEPDQVPEEDAESPTESDSGNMLDELEWILTPEEESRLVKLKITKQQVIDAAGMNDKDGAEVGPWFDGTTDAMWKEG